MTTKPFATRRSTSWPLAALAAGLGLALLGLAACDDKQSAPPARAATEPGAPPAAPQPASQPGADAPQKNDGPRRAYVRLFKDPKGPIEPPPKAAKAADPIPEGYGRLWVTAVQHADLELSVLQVGYNGNIFAEPFVDVPPGTYVLSSELTADGPKGRLTYRATGRVGVAAGGTTQATLVFKESAPSPPAGH